MSLKKAIFLHYDVSSTSRTSTQSRPLPLVGGANNVSRGGTTAKNCSSPVRGSNQEALTAVVHKNCKYIRMGCPKGEYAKA